jgi:hypothetical protein
VRAGVLTGLSTLAPASAASGPHAPAATVRDRLWLWGHFEGSHNGVYNLPGHSRITPVEAAYYLSIPNVAFVRFDGRPEAPFDQYALPFRALREVVWSVVGADGDTSKSERDLVLSLVRRNANASGVILDDFFNGATSGQVGALSLDQLQGLRAQLRTGRRRTDLWVALYTHQPDSPAVRHALRAFDVVTLWTWRASDLDRMASHLRRSQAMAPHARTILGCYMWDYGDKRPMPAKLMRHQCEQGLAWLRQGKIDGMIFLASCICDLNIAAVEWTRGWIARVGGESVPARGQA